MSCQIFKVWQKYNDYYSWQAVIKQYKEKSDWLDILPKLNLVNELGVKLTKHISKQIISIFYS